MFWVGLVIGLISGGMFGAGFMAMMVVAKKADQDMGIDR